MLRQNTSTKRVFHPVYRQNTPTKGYFILIETKHPDYMCILFWKQYCGAPPSYVSFYGRKHCGMFAWLYASRTIFGPNRANCARFKTLSKHKFKTGKYYFHFFFSNAPVILNMNQSHPKQHERAKHSEGFTSLWKISKILLKQYLSEKRKIGKKITGSFQVQTRVSVKYIPKTRKNAVHHRLHECTTKFEINRILPRKSDFPLDLSIVAVNLEEKSMSSTWGWSESLQLHEGYHRVKFPRSLTLSEIKARDQVLLSFVMTGCTLERSQLFPRECILCMIQFSRLSSMSHCGPILA